MLKAELKELERRKEQSEQAKVKTAEANRKYLAWEHLSRNQKEVAKRILAGNYELLKDSGWGFLDKFVIFLKTIGFLEVLNVDGEGYIRRMITVAKLLLTYQVKVLLGISSMNKVPDTLFKDTGLLMLLGFTARQIKHGHCKRGQKRDVVMHKDTLADALEKFSAEEVEKILNESVKILDKGKFIDDDTYICDSTDIETTEKCKDCGRKTVEEKHLNKKTGEIIKTLKTTYGFKLLVIRGAKSGIIVSAKFAKIQDSEKNYTLRLIKQAEQNISKKIKVLLLDRGFIDGITLWEMKHNFKIDFVIPATTAMDITKDARGLRNKNEEGIWREIAEEITAVGIKGLTSYDQYGDEEHNKKNRYSEEFEANPINVVMVTKWNKQEYPRGKEKVFLTTLRVDKPISVIKKYKLRSLIENTTFRELKTGWLIDNIPKKTEPAVRTHVFLTVCMYNMCKAYRSQLGKEITEQGIRKFRTKTFADTINKVVIISEPYYGIFDLEELAILWGRPPKYFMSINPKKFKEEYGLTEKFSDAEKI
ncbi:transposase [Candidatus Parcubacteria bacterium]|nr:transposase [Candidatus Parcubacteria bacterium]